MEETKNTLSDDQLANAKQDIEALLLKHNIVLIPIVIHHGDRTISRIDIAPAGKNTDEPQS
jgi:hypothetical protein